MHRTEGLYHIAMHRTEGLYHIAMHRTEGLYQIKPEFCIHTAYCGLVYILHDVCGLVYILHDVYYTKDKEYQAADIIVQDAPNPNPKDAPALLALVHRLGTPRPLLTGLDVAKHFRARLCRVVAAPGDVAVLVADVEVRVRVDVPLHLEPVDASTFVSVLGPVHEHRVLGANAASGACSYEIKTRG